MKNQNKHEKYIYIYNLLKLQWHDINIINYKYNQPFVKPLYIYIYIYIYKVVSETQGHRHYHVLYIYIYIYI